MRAAVFIGLTLAIGCKKAEDKKADVPASKTTEKKEPRIVQVDPPLDLKNPPKDAVRTPSGLIVKTLQANPQGQAPKRNDTVMIKYTGWRQATGETFYSNHDQAMPLNLSSTAPGFTEAMQMVKKGERAMLWMPPDIGLKEKTSKAETNVYEVEVVEIQEAPA